MHRQFRKLLENATGTSQHIIAIVLDIRGFTPFCQTVDSLDVATYVKKVYMKIIDNYFANASFYKPTGDGLLVIIPYTEESLKEVVNKTIESCLNLLQDFRDLCKNEAMINFDTPNSIGIGITRGSACCISSEEKILDYSGKVLNLASRLMDIARPSGIVFDSNFGVDLLQKKNRKLFLEDTAYVRGIAEEKPITVYCTRALTLIPDFYKKPLKEPKWENIEHKNTFRNLKLLTRTLSLDLHHQPLDVNQIMLIISHYKIVGRRVVKEYSTYRYYDIDDDILSYVKRGKTYSVNIYSELLAKLLEKHRVKKDMEVKLEVIYPTK